MAKKTTKKKVVTITNKPSSQQTKNTLSPTTSKSVKTSGSNKPGEPLLFGKQNYILMLVGVLLMSIGFILMLGGSMPDTNTWDEDIIYGFRRTVLAPFMILAGLVTLIFSIFRKQPGTN